MVLWIVGFTTVMVYDPDTGEQLEPTHYCKSRELKMYCARTTAQFCRPSLNTTKGSKRCVEGWKPIPDPLPTRINLYTGNRFICNKDGCISTRGES